MPSSGDGPCLHLATGADSSGDGRGFIGSESGRGRERAKAEAARTNRSETQLEDQTVTVKKIEADIADLRGRLDTAMTQLAEQKAEVVRILSFNRNIVT